MEHHNYVLATDANFDETEYLAANPDVAKAVLEGRVGSGRVHFDLDGRREGRKTLDRGPHRRSWITRVLFVGIRSIVPSFLKDAIRQYIRRQITSTDLEQLRDVQSQLQQVVSILHHELNIPLPPPKHLQTRVIGAYRPDFIESGFAGVYQSLNQVLKPTGKELRDFQSILDFGCGCGRATRAFASMLPASKLYGTDIDVEAIEWLKRNYSGFAEFSVAPHLPPTIYEDRMFDLVFGISVLTHLPEDMQFQWLGELSRITRPLGYVILTTSGERYYRDLDAGIRDIMNREGFFYTGFGGNCGARISLPDFYQVAYHSRAYIRREWAPYFDVIDIQATGIDNNQDSVLLRKRGQS